MRAALADAGLTYRDIDYINTHGTSTQENDSIETLAIKTVFQERPEQVPASSVKSMLGHLIGAAGAAELIACVLAIRDNVVPPTMNLHDPDPELDLDYVPNVPRKMPVNIVMKESFGFGGQNNVVIVKRLRTNRTASCQLTVLGFAVAHCQPATMGRLHQLRGLSMIDIKLIRDNPDLFIQAAKNKRIDANIPRLLEVDGRLRDAKTKLQDIATEKNRVGKSVPKLSGDEKNAAIARLSELKQQEEQLTNEVKTLQPEFDALLLEVPQPADPDVPVGKDDTENVEVRREGQVRQFDFEPKDHVQLGTGAGHHRHRARRQAGRRAQLLPQGRRRHAALGRPAVCRRPHGRTRVYADGGAAADAE